MQSQLLLPWKKLEAADIQLIAPVLPHAQSLVELDLRHNKLKDPGAKALADALRHAAPKLATVRLMRNKSLYHNAPGHLSSS